MAGFLVRALSHSIVEAVTFSYVNYMHQLRLNSPQFSFRAGYVGAVDFEICTCIVYKNFPSSKCRVVCQSTGVCRAEGLRSSARPRLRRETKLSNTALLLTTHRFNLISVVGFENGRRSLN